MQTTCITTLHKYQQRVRSPLMTPVIHYDWMVLESSWIPLLTTHPQIDSIMQRSVLEANPLTTTRPASQNYLSENITLRFLFVNDVVSALGLLRWFGSAPQPKWNDKSSICVTACKCSLHFKLKSFVFVNKCFSSVCLLFIRFRRVSKSCESLDRDHNEDSVTECGVKTHGFTQ